MPCNECPETPDTGCLQPITTECVTYDGNDIDCADISSGQTLNQVIEQLANNDCDLQEQIEDIVQDVEELSGNVNNLQDDLEELSGSVQTQIDNIPTFSCEDLSGCSIDDLLDVDVSPISGDILMSNGIKWVNYTPEDIIPYEFTCEELSGCTLDELSGVTITTPLSGDVLINNGNQFINYPLSSLISINASNGLTELSGSVKLGGVLTENTTIDTDSSYLFLNKNITSTVNTSSFPLLLENHITTGGTESTKTVKTCVVASLKVDLSSNLTVSTDNNKHGAFAGTVYKDTIRNWVGKLPVYFAEQEHASSGNTTWAISYLAAPPSQYGGETTFTGTITNAAGLFINDISASNITARITNKYGIYQEGASDKNVFYGEIEYHGSLTNASDARSKNKGNSFTKGLVEIEQIVPVFFTKKEGFGDTSISHVGIIAQEIENIIPEAIKIGKVKEIEDFRLFDQSVLIYTLINAVKELSQKVKTLENANR